jgi:hypothetical protein
MIGKLLISVILLGIFVQVESLECYNCTSLFHANCATMNSETTTMICPTNGTEWACVKSVVIGKLRCLLF